MKINKHISQVLYLVIFWVLSCHLQAQEINATVTVDHRQLEGTNVSVFQTLEKALTEFVNNRRWTNDEYEFNERVNCNFYFNLSSNSGSSYSGSLTVSARRPIYNAAINTTIINLVDNDLSFSYNEFDQLILNKNSLTQDLTAILGFYVYTILGLDADSFKEFGGNAYYNEAISIVNSAESSTTLSEGGWDRIGSKRNRHVLIAEILSSDFTPLRRYLYQYHRHGLDVMADNAEQGANVILSGLEGLKEVANNAPSSYTMLLFFDVKTKEIQSIVGEMDTEDEAVAKQKEEVVKTLKKLDPSRLKAYNKLLE